MLRLSSHDDGHYVALRKINGQWWHLSDEKVTKVPEKDLADHDMGQIFFLSRLD